MGGAGGTDWSALGGSANAGGASGGIGGTTSGGSAIKGGTSSGGSANAGSPNAGSANGGHANAGAPNGGNANAGTTSAGAQSGGANAGANSGGVSSGPPEVRLIGRMDRSDAAGPRFAWSGSGVVARFEGSTVSVSLKGAQQYTVLIDGELQAKLISKDGPNPLASGLSSGTHTVELYRRTEANLGESQFLGFDFGAGRLLAPPAAARRRLEVVGDSISCGYGNEGLSKDCSFSPDTENHYQTYAAIAARNLGAELVTVAWSGKGVVCNYGDAADSCVDPMPKYYERTLPERADSRWDFTSYVPDAVILNLGTNDFSTDDDPSDEQFSKGYQDLLETIRGKYASATILCTVAPLLGGADLQKAQALIQGIVKKLNDAGDLKVKTFTMGAPTSAEGYGCDWHPSLTTHQRLAAELTAVLQTTLNW